MQSFRKALLFEPLSFCSFACFRQATDFAALCSSCWVGLMFCATRSDFEAELCALAGKPASPRATTKIPADAKRRSMWFLPEEISNFATTVALPQIELSSSMQSLCPLYPRKRTEPRPPKALLDLPFGSSGRYTTVSILGYNVPSRRRTLTNVYPVDANRFD